MTRKPNLALNAEVESSGRAAKLRTELEANLKQEHSNDTNTD